MVHIKKGLLIYGLVIWLVATIALRVAGQYLLRPGLVSSTGWIRILILYAVSFVAMGLLVRRVCASTRLPGEEWLAGAVSLALPTLVLDPFSSAFFPVVFPNMAPSLAGMFGGWMLICCAGAALGGMLRVPRVGQN
jgi:hypothetical protein